MKIPGARVVPQAAPEREHVVERRRGQGTQRGKPRQEALVVGDHDLHSRLLQHHFADPDAVRVAGLFSPGKIAPRRREPREQALGDCAIHPRP